MHASLIGCYMTDPPLSRMRELVMHVAAIGRYGSEATAELGFSDLALALTLETCIGAGCGAHSHGPMCYKRGTPLAR